ncbi:MULTISPECIES: hypothetical protein [Streptomyces]|uniref:hypothetical protein n=1 Tax=Streptomyces TaxID=1883 RepID=UPI0012FEBF40|nr:hypothetical protein [Streptomyces griseolus]MCW8217073.1 hypothetical protein [Streptomyces griseolus]
MEQVSIPLGLRTELAETFGGLGDPSFGLSKTVFLREDCELTVSATLDVILANGHSEKWILSLVFPEFDAAAAGQEATAEAHAWFALMVQTNIIEWWHTRETAPNMPTAPQRIG